MKAAIRAILTRRGPSGNSKPKRGRSSFRELNALAEIKTGDRFGLLVVVEQSGEKWRCLCECDGPAQVWARDLIRGLVDRCENCLKGVGFKSRVRDAARYQEWQTYISARARCENPKITNWENYGGRGILFKFQTFEDFYEHLGPRPFGKTLDRYPDNDGNYEKGNVRWATPAEQMQNTRSTKLMPKDVCFIRKAAAAGVKRRVLARWFQVSKITIRDVELQETWANI